jgi:ABC-type branched-subunit amino acid transport system substrate-binding protein
VDNLIEAVRAGASDSAFEGEVKIVTSRPNGLPDGSEHEFRRGFLDLAETGVLGIIGPGLTENALIARDLADEHRIPTIIWAGHERVRSEWSFHYQIGSLEEEAPLLLRHLVDRGVKRVALVYDDINIVLQYVDYFDVARRLHDIEVVARAATSPDVANATQVIESINNPHAEALVYFGWGRSAVPISQAIRAADWNIPVVGCSSLMAARARTDMAALWNGWIYVDIVSDHNPATNAAAQRLGPAISGSPIGLCFYDMGRLMGEALDRALYRTRASLRDGFERVKRLPSAIGHPGTTMTCGYWDRAILKGPFLVLREWQDSKSVPLQT